MASNQVLVPNLGGKYFLIALTVVAACFGLFERRTKLVLQDGTELTGKVVGRTDEQIQLERPSGKVVPVAAADVASESWLHFEVDLDLGLDLKGGTTLRYGVQAPAEMDPREALDSTIAVFNERLDNLGVKEISIVPSYEANEIVIELPGVTMEESDAYERVVSSLGMLEFRIVVDASTAEVNVEREREKLRKHLEANPGWTPQSLRLGEFDVKGRGNVVYRWYPWEQKAIDEGQVDRSFPFSLLTIDPDQTITGRDLSAVYPAFDSNGRPAVGFSLKPERAADFGEFTGSHVDRRMAIVLDGAIKSAPNLNSRIERQGIIEGGRAGFSQAEEKELRTVLSSGSLTVKPIRLSKATIGPTLGEASIRRSMIAGALATLLVLVFINFYYPGRVGLITCATLLLGVFLLIGGLGFLGATITLPGIAGIILTIGMAVDQNILILERVREEREKGKTMFQSMKNGFERAFVTIFDSQATTFLAGFVLYYFGSGPIRGFAVTLMLGIVTTMFAAIVGSKVLFAVGLDRGWFDNLRFRNPLGQLNVQWMKYQRKGLTISAVLTVVGMAAFVYGYQDMKGLDFAGGFQAHVRLTEPTPPGQVDELVRSRFPGAQVVALRSVEGGQTGGQENRDYLVKIRADREGGREFQEADVSANVGDAGAAGEPLDPSAAYIAGLTAAFGDRLLPQGIADLAVTPAAQGGGTNASFTIHLDAPIDASVLQGRLNDVMAVEAVEPTDPNGYRVRAAFPTQRPVEQVRGLVASALTNLPGGVRLSDPIPESQFIGSKVGKELANNAIIAVVLATIGILIYIRIRFRDVKWGLAACLAGAHDTILGLGVVAICAQTGLLNVELDLTMIGAFLTLIGYSLNDTIVIFDRIRENIPRVDRPLREVIDLSINQTMSRTLLTGGTVLGAVLIMFVLSIGHNTVIEGFAFVMWTGVLIGTYSSIFVAGPLLLWLIERDRKAGRGGAAQPSRPQAASA